ncbi:MAG: SufE family protein [Candidatus Omnitrophica bacterium]|nr:SufE family protein [Candidatus Omnitrophota bacterium]MCF7892448.1 SufE family protein [Candidatus Omnitrophota bacterium]MCF7895447.1 SufE family protein [Candidatus Omnitrophota bacterium]MCF7897827.1 SufE family protein [Candidatus Omnitrophota bacterium]MCF7909735.1 SufE family protein [Candidatus Omnitrophota bacterium]
MANINNIQDEIIKEMSQLKKGMGKYLYLINLAKQLTPFKPELKTENNLIKGCQSRVWLASELKNGRMHYFADSDTAITKGVVALLLKILNNQSPQAICNADLYFIKKTDLESELSPIRANGLLSALEEIKNKARQYRRK